MMEKELSQWGWPAVAAFAGALLGYIHKGGPSKSIRTALLSILTSMFLAGVTYGLSGLFIELAQARVSVAGLVSYMSTNSVVVFEEIIIRTICKKLGIELPDRRQNG